MKKEKFELRTNISLLAGKVVLKILKLMNRQASSLPGFIMQKIDKNILSKLAKNRRIIVVTGTNGKTTTAMFIYDFLKVSGKSCDVNASGANLSSGLCTSLLQSKAKDFNILEVDEACFAKVAADLNPYIVLVTNLYRDQLDRYGELDAVYKLILNGIKDIPKTNLLLCADDPKVAHLFKDSGHAKERTFFFGKNFIFSDYSGDFSYEMAGQSSSAELFSTLNLDNECKHEKNLQEDRTSVASLMATIDSAICPCCGSLLKYKCKSLAQLGDFYCDSCSYRKESCDFLFNFERGEIFEFSRTDNLLQRDLSFLSLATSDDLLLKKFRQGNSGHTVTKAPLAGLYNAYNLAAALSVADLCCDNTIARMLDACKNMTARFGRQERVKLQNGKEVCFILVKNPTGYSQALQILATAEDLGAVAFLLNDNPPDGVDVSWIWDIPFETVKLPETSNVLISGKRYHDLALRLSYWGLNITSDVVCEEAEASKKCLDLIEKMDDNSTLYILPNYTAMLNLRRDLTSSLGLSDKWVEE